MHVIFPPVSFLSRSAFFFNYLYKSMFWSFVNICTDYTVVYGCITKYLHDQIIKAHLFSELALTNQWEKNRLLTFNTWKTKLISLRHYRPVNGCSFKEDPCFVWLFKYKRTLQPMWISYIGSLVKDADKIVAFLYSVSKTHSSIIYHNTSQVSSERNYCCHIFAEPDQFSLSFFDRIWKPLRRHVVDVLFSTLQPFSHGLEVASRSLLSRYIHG